MTKGNNMANQTDREYVVSFLHHSGARAGELTTAQQRKVRLLADGFGKTSNPDLLWDWSHVRDSSDEALAAMAEAIRAVVEGGCKTCGGAGMVRPHPTALVAVRCPSC